MSFLQCAKYTVVYNQIANESFVLLNASILGEYREIPSLRSASHAQRQDSVIGGHKQIFWGGTKSLILQIRECGPKKCLHLKICADFYEFWGETTKKKGFYYKSAKKQLLLTNSGVITSILGVSGLELHFSGTEPVTFFGAQFSLGGHKQRLGGHGPGMPPVASGLLQLYSNLLNCKYRFFV